MHMTFEFATQFYCFLPWGDACLEYCLKCESACRSFQPEEGPSRGLLRDYEPSDGPSFQALRATSQQYLILHQLASKYYADCEIIDIMTCVFQSPLSIHNMIY